MSRYAKLAPFAVLIFSIVLHSLIAGSTRSAAQWLIQYDDLVGTWSWYTNPLQQKHKWSGSFSIVITEQDRQRRGFSGRMSPGNGIIAGSWTPLEFTRETSVDKNGAKTQTYRVTHITIGTGTPKMWGRWTGSYDYADENKGDDFDFAALKQ